MNIVKVPSLVFSRTCGYFAPVFHGEKSFTWNPGKVEEYKERKMIQIDMINSYIKS